jgi:diguanylate cyclase (GGDEF)-like protein/PAS domain S-box-containing protein
MFTADETEIAWLTRNKTATRFIALSAILLFASYGVVDWLLAPDLLGTTLLWRIAGVLPCLAIYFLMGRDHWLPRIPVLLAAGCVVVTVVISIIFLYLLHTPTIALAGQMQVLISVSMFATMRTAIRATVSGLWASFNLGLWWLNEPAESFLLHNLYLLGGAFVTVVISEVSYRTFRSRLALEAVVQQQADIVQSSDDAIVGRAPDGVVTSWNPGAQRLFGYTAHEMIGRSLQPLFSPDMSTQEQDNLQRVLRGNAVIQFETERFCKNGDRKELSVSASPIRDAGGTVVGISEIARDVSEKNRNARALHEKEARFRAAIETTPDGFWAVDSTGRIIDVNLSSCRLTGYSREELLGLRITDLEAQEDPAATARHIEEIMRAGSATFETVHRRKDGSTWPVEIITTFSPILGGQFYAFLRDLTERKKAEAMTWRQANFDHLTNLPNRALLFDRLNQECTLARRNQTRVALLFADLDGFKLVNDNHGHQAGDLVLKEVARRWLATVRESDTVARLGGDEFAILMSGVQDGSDIGALAEKLVAALAAPITLQAGVTCQVGASVGIAIYPTDASTPDNLISRADAAMYESKRRGKNTFSFTSP